MEIIKGALAQDYRGPIYKLLEQAAAKKAEQMQGQQPQQPQQRETGGLVQSYESAPPSMINLPTGQKMGKADTLEDAGRYRTGGVKKYENGGDLSEEEMDLAYEDYTMGREMEDRDNESDYDSSISYNQFAKRANTYGVDQAMGYYSNKEGKVLQPFSNWQSSSAKKAASQNQIQSWSQEQKTQYYNELYGGNELISPTEMMQMDQAAWDKANPPEPSALDAINSELTIHKGVAVGSEQEQVNYDKHLQEQGQIGGDIVREATNKAAPYVLGGLGLVAAAPFAIGGLAAGTGGGLIGAGSRQAVKPLLRYGNKAIQGFQNAFGATQGLGTSWTSGNTLYRGRQLLSGIYNTAKTVAVPQMYSTVAGQAGTEVRGEGDYKNRLKTVSKLADLVPALNTGKDVLKITSDLASGDYKSASLRGLTTFAPGFKKSKQFGTGIRYHTTKLVNKFLDTKPTDEDAGIVGDINKLRNTISNPYPLTDLGTSGGEEKVVMKKGGVKKSDKNKKENVVTEVVDAVSNPHKYGMVFTDKSMSGGYQKLERLLSPVKQYYNAYIKDDPYARAAIEENQASRTSSSVLARKLLMKTPFVAAMLSPLNAGKGSTVYDEDGVNKYTGEKEYTPFRKGGFKKRKKHQSGGLNLESSSSTGLPIGAGVAGSRNDPQQAMSRAPEVSELLYNLDWGDATKTYLNETFNPTKWFDGKSASKAAYNELVPLNARLLIEDVAEEQLFNKDAVYGKYSPLAYLPESAKKFLGYKDEVTEKDLSKGELEALTSVVENRKKSNRLGYYDYPGGGVGGTSMLEKMTDNNTVLETTLGQTDVHETDHDYTVKDTFDFNYVKWREDQYKRGDMEDNLYNYIRWNFAPKYGSVDNAGMPVNINIPKIGDGTNVTKTGAKQFDEGPKFAKKGGVRYKKGGVKGRKGSTYMVDKMAVINDPVGNTKQFSDTPMYEGHQESTHLMADNNKDEAWPTIFQDENGNWFEGGYEEAKRRGEIYKFDSKKELIDFARKGNWKKETGGVKKGSGKVLYNKVNKKKFKRIKRKK